MTSEQLQNEIIIPLLGAFNKNRDADGKQILPTQDNTLNEYLATDDRISASTSANIFKTALLFSIKTNLGRKLRIKFPPNWLDFSVKDIADNLIAQATK